MIEFRNITYKYSSGDAAEYAALRSLSLKIEKGEFIGIAGHTGSGKSTAAQIAAGLINPTSGEILIDGKQFESAAETARELRKRVGIVFQYPEHQLFEETVYRDIAFAPKNRGLGAEEADECVRRSAALAGVSEELFEKSPFELSGGQKRRVAIAGVLAASPSVLILDEPAAGLDPAGRRKLLSLLRKIHAEESTSIILISHSMEDLAENAGRIVILGGGEKLADDIPENIFTNGELLKKSGLDMPEITKTVQLLQRGGMELDSRIFTVSDAAKAIAKAAGVIKC